MPRKPSAETQLRGMKRLLRQRADDIALLQFELKSYRARATQAEQTAAEWKKRFDALLYQKVPPLVVEGPKGPLFLPGPFIVGDPIPDPNASTSGTISTSKSSSEGK